MALRRELAALAVHAGREDIEGGRLPQPRQHLRFGARDQVEQPPHPGVDVVEPDRLTGAVIDRQVGAGGERELPQRRQSGIGHQRAHLNAMTGFHQLPHPRLCPHPHRRSRP